MCGLVLLLIFSVVDLEITITQLPPSNVTLSLRLCVTLVWNMLNLRQLSSLDATFKYLTECKCVQVCADLSNHTNREIRDYGGGDLRKSSYT